MLVAPTPSGLSAAMVTTTAALPTRMAFAPASLSKFSYTRKYPTFWQNKGWVYKKYQAATPAKERKHLCQ